MSTLGSLVSQATHATPVPLGAESMGSNGTLRNAEGREAHFLLT